MKTQKSPADHADLRRRTTNNKTTLTTICLSLRYNAACCIPLRDLRYLRENIHPNLLNLYCSNETPVSPADLADLRRQTTKHQNNKTSNHNNHTNSLARAHSISIKQVSKCRISDIQSLNLGLSVLKVSVKCRSFIIHRHIITAGIATYHVVTLAVQYMTYTHDVTIVHGYIAILLLHLLHDLCCCKA